MDSLIETFHIDWKLIVAQAVNFAVVIVVLYWFALRPLKKLMQERSKKIEGGIKDAKKNEEVLAKSEEEYKAKLAQARKEAQEVLAKAVKDAEAKGVLIVEKAEQKAGEVIKKGEEELERERERIVKDAQAELAALIVHSTEKVLKGVVDERKDHAYIKEVVEKVL